ncbi:hypothetical protein EDEG_03042 [Edhazardia aedis USNM 41457]|uniref:Uncharacterized protein n=1 Tax=Edhazardia aedis (strain USNM 41457) TaxID=1003232 RepID=J9DIU3_EDHAE|nr:hypothetical protein EDEG_03042 [Edhazardia aedis USNM 41457]|eukprot:EJW02530.1 hypothetical protein EDEG_03042 [Edhazardia aedis USNM 41457]
MIRRKVMVRIDIKKMIFSTLWLIGIFTSRKNKDTCEKCRMQSFSNRRIERQYNSIIKISKRYVLDICLSPIIASNLYENIKIKHIFNNPNMCISQLKENLNKLTLKTLNIVHENLLILEKKINLKKILENCFRAFESCNKIFKKICDVTLTCLKNEFSFETKYSCFLVNASDNRRIRSKKEREFNLLREKYKKIKMM